MIDRRYMIIPRLIRVAKEKKQKNRQRNKKHSPYEKQTHFLNFIVPDCYYEDEIVRLSFGRLSLSKWQQF